MSAEEPPALLAPRPQQCLVLRFAACPRAHPGRCLRCTVVEQARMAALLARPYWRRRAQRGHD